MDNFKVKRLKVDEKGQELDEVIWTGKAENSEDAKTKCLTECYEEKDREFMRWYLKAFKTGCNICKAFTSQQVGNMYVCDHCGALVP